MICETWQKNKYYDHVYQVHLLGGPDPVLGMGVLEEIVPKLRL